MLRTHTVMLMENGDWFTFKIQVIIFSLACENAWFCLSSNQTEMKYEIGHIYFTRVCKFNIYYLISKDSGCNFHLCYVLAQSSICVLEFYAPGYLHNISSALDVRTNTETFKRWVSEIVSTVQLFHEMVRCAHHLYKLSRKYRNIKILEIWLQLKRFLLWLHKFGSYWDKMTSAYEGAIQFIY